MGAAIILNKGGGHTKVYCHANYANCDTFAVLIPFQIFILSAVQSFSKTEWYFYKKMPKMYFFMYRCYFFAHNCICQDLHVFGLQFSQKLTNHSGSCMPHGMVSGPLRQTGSTSSQFELLRLK